MNKRLVSSVLALVCILLLPASVSALIQSKTAGSWYVAFVYWEEPGTPVFYVVHLGGEMILEYSNHTSPWPGYLQVERNDLSAIVFDYYAPFPYHHYPFGIAPGIISIRRYDDGVLKLTLTSFSSYPIIHDPDDYWICGENFTDSYLVKDAGSSYKFVGTVGFLSDCSPWYVEKTLTKYFNY